MFTDSRLSMELTDEFKPKLKNLISHSLDFSVNICTSTYWPFPATDVSCLLPKELGETLVHFDAFYMSKYSGRRLMWLKNMGTADVVARFSVKKELNMSNYCMLLLLNSFNTSENPPLSWAEIKEQTEIPDEELKRALLSLSFGKHRILLKSIKSKEITDQDTFQANLEFTSPLSKIKILTISSNQSSSNVNAEDAKERQATLERISEDRKYQIEAAIVRTMKFRKTLDHNNLVSSAIQQLSARFMPDPVMVKKRIESLIERDYLERDENSRGVYNYVA
jgi:cullin 3